MVDGLHQPDVALVDKVFQRQGAALVLFGHADHKAQVGTHEPFLGTLCLRTFSMELAAQLSLLLRTDHPLAGYLVEIHAQSLGDTVGEPARFLQLSLVSIV